MKFEFQPIWTFSINTGTISGQLNQAKTAKSRRRKRSTVWTSELFLAISFFVCVEYSQNYWIEYEI